MDDSSSTPDELKHLKIENRALMKRNEDLIDKVIDLQEEELQRLKRENSALRTKIEGLIEEQDLKCLKSQSRALRIERDDLTDEIIDLQRKLDTCNQTFREISSLRKPFAQPAPEILHLIFERTIPPHFLINSSASFCPNSLWSQVQQQKNAIVNVCQTWHGVGLPFLYEHVSIRRVHQLSNLLRTLHDSSQNSNLMEMIKTVEIRCIVPTWYAQQFEQQLRVLFGICPRITSCAFQSQISQFQLPSTTSLCALAPNITTLFLDDGIEMDILNNIAEFVSPYIISLSFHIPLAPPSTTTAMRKTHFRHLEDISIWSRSAPTSLDALVHDWEIPYLKRLTFQLDHPPQIKCLQNFCDAHGAGLQYLHISIKYGGIFVEDLLNSCLALEHLILSPLNAGSLTHKRVKWIDIWMSSVTADAVEALRSNLRNSNLPALKGVRTLPRDLYECSYNLPYLIPPNLVLTPSDIFACQFLEVGIRHGVGEIMYIGPDWPTDADEDGDDSDDLFIPDESDSSDESEHSDGSSVWEVALHSPDEEFSWMDNL